MQVVYFCWEFEVTDAQQRFGSRIVSIERGYFDCLSNGQHFRNVRMRIEGCTEAEIAELRRPRY